MSSIPTNLLIAAGGLTVYIVFKRWYASRNSTLASIPKVPGGHWLWGHEQEAWDTPNEEFFSKNFEQYGGAFAMKGGLGSQDLLAISDSAALTHMFTKHPYMYPKSPFIRPLVERLMGRSLPWAEGEEHRRQRIALAPVFTHENVRAMDPEIRDAADKLVASLRSHVNNMYAEASEKDDSVEINAMDWSCKATLDIIGSVGFGHDFQHGESKEAKAIQRSFRELVQLGMTPAGFIAPQVLKAFPFISDLPVEAIQRQGEVKLIIKGLAGKMVEEKRRMIEGGEMRGKDLLSTLLRMQDQHGHELDLILDHISALVLVGHETTSTALNFTLYNLAHNKHWQDRLRQELLSFPNAQPTYDDFLNRLPILEAITKEAMRIHPAVSHTERMALRDDILPLRTPVRDPRTGEEVHSIVIKKGQTIHVSHMAINRNKNVWGPDADEFKPERWLTTLPDTGNGEKEGVVSALPPPTTATQGWNGTFTFIEGPRICIGLRLALFEYKVILTELIKNFEFLPVPGEEGVIDTMFSSSTQPYRKGKRDAGVTIPVRVRSLNA